LFICYANEGKYAAFHMMFEGDLVWLSYTEYAREEIYFCAEPTAVT